jgi:hypothetical protein
MSDLPLDIFLWAVVCSNCKKVMVSSGMPGLFEDKEAAEEAAKLVSTEEHPAHVEQLRVTGQRLVNA